MQERLRPRRGIRIGCCLLLGSVFLSGCSGEEGRAARRAPGSAPDIVLVLIDTLRADHLGVYGHSRPTSPNLDALAADGVWFRRAYAHSSWTLPSVASLLTGQLPHRHRVVRDPLRPDRFGRLPPDAVTLAELLRDVGYRCGAIINNTFLAPEFGLHQGFEGHYDYRGATKQEIRPAEEAVDAALAWFGGQPAPRFLLLHVMDPHLFYDPPAAVRYRFTGRGEPPVEVPFVPDEKFERLRSGRAKLSDEELSYVVKLYDEEILATDLALGRFFEGLAQYVHREDAFVIVTSDHGEEFYDHGAFEHGHTLFSELTRVPLIVRGPGMAGGAIDAIVQHIDLFRGILGIAGVDPVPGVLGTDLFAVARGESVGARSVLSESVLDGPSLVSLVDERYRLLVDLDSRQAEVWRLDELGRESVLLETEALRVEGERLTRELEQLRGGLRPIGAVSGPEVPDRDTFLELQALGYVE